MKTNQIIKTCGSITKLETLIPVDYNILNNTYVVETQDPYPGYYGKVPKLSKPNSLYLITNRNYRLDEILRFIKNMDYSDKDTISFASAILDFKYHIYNAIRIKFFPDYDLIYKLQSEFINSGVEFVKKRHIVDSAQIKVFKCIELKQIEDGIYLDDVEVNHGYFRIPAELSFNEFSDIIFDIRNNIESINFDAAIGSLLMDSNLTDVVRIYSDNLDLSLLKIIQEKFMHILHRESVPRSEHWIG